MRIEGSWIGDAPFLVAFLISEELDIQKRIVFLIDTGASRTNILDGDAIRLGIDYSKIQRHEEGTTGIGGVVDTHIMPEVKLLFRTFTGDIHEENLGEIFVLKHDFKAMKREEVKRVKMLPSLLGRDFLNRCKVILDRVNEKITVTDEALNR